MYQNEFKFMKKIRALLKQKTKKKLAQNNDSKK